MSKAPGLTQFLPQLADLVLKIDRTRLPPEHVG